MTGLIFLETSSYSVNETNATASVTIQRSGDTSGAVTIEYATNPGSASEGADYADTDGTIVMPAGSSQVTVTIPLVDDDASEPTESFNFSLISVDSGALLFPRTANISILDDENPAEDPVDPPLQTDYDVTTEDVITDLFSPIAIKWLPDGSSTALVAEKIGLIRVVDTETGTIESTFIDIRDQVNSNADRGLMDIAIHPDFPSEPYIYAFIVVDPPESASASGLAQRDAEGNRFAHLVRYEATMEDGVPTLVEDSATVILGGAGQSLSDISGNGELNYTSSQHQNELASDVDPATGDYKQDYIKVDSQSHAGGALAFGPDGALYVSVGDGTSFNFADPRTVSVQDPDSLSGKILRIDPITGEGLADNPFVEPGDDLNSNSSKVFQLGLRNPYNMAFSEDGALFISETGWYSYEEINSGEAGANFGWPFYEGGDAGQLEKTPVYRNIDGADAFYAAVAAGDIVVTPAYRGFSHNESDPGYEFNAIVGSSSIYTGDKYPDVFEDDYFFTDIIDGEVFTVDSNDRTQLQYLMTVPGYGPVNFSQGPDGYMYYVDLVQDKIVRINITDPNAAENQAPFVNQAIAHQDAVAGGDFSFAVPAGTFADADDTDLTLTATLADGSPPPAWLDFNPATGVFSGTPGTGDIGSLTVTVTAYDDDGAAAGDSFAITVGAANDAPVVALPIDNQTAEEDAVFSFTLPAGTFADADPLTLAATLSDGAPLPGWLAFDPATGTFSGTPDDADIGTLAVTVTATDPSGETVGDSFALTVTATNEAPVVTAPVEDQTAAAGTAFSFTAPGDVFTDPDGDQLTLSATLADGSELPDWLSFDAPTGTFSGTPEGTDEGTVNIRLTATDPSGESTFDVFALDVTAANTPPVVAAPIADQTAAEEAGFSFTVPAGTFTDADGDDLSLTATLADGSPLPSWLTFDPATATFAGTPDDPDIGALTVRVTATDPAGAAVSDSFGLSVTPVNDAPVVASPILDQTAATDTAYSFTAPGGVFDDADGDPLTLTATLEDGAPLPDWLSFDPSTATFTGTPGAADEGTVNIRLTAEDPSGETAFDLFALDVVAGNAPPVVATPIDDQAATEEAAFSFTVPAGTFNDPNGDELTLSASLSDGSPLPDWLSFDAATGTFSGTPDDPDVGALAVSVRATDPDGAEAADTFTLTVDAVNDAPVLANAIADQAASEGEGFAFTLPANTFDDVDDTSLDLGAGLANGDPLPDWLTFDPATGTFTGTPAAGDVGTLSIEVTATDDENATVGDVFDIDVSADTGSDETLVDDDPDANQFETGETDNDVFVIAGSSSDYGWAPTENGEGVVIWNDAGFDILFDFETIRFNDKDVAVSSILQTGPTYVDDPDQNQFVTGETADDTFVIDGPSGDYDWEATGDGNGVVIWTTDTADDSFDILYDIENIQFTDQTVDISGLTT